MCKHVDPFRCQSAIIVDDMSDHFPCTILIPNFLPIINVEKTIHYRKYTEDGILKVNQDLLFTDWENILNDDVDQNYLAICECIKKSLDIHIPFQTRTEIEGASLICHPPWYNKSIKKCINKSKHLFRNSISNPSQKANFRKYRNALNRLILHEKTRYFERKFEEFHNNGNVTWGLINNVISRHNDKSCVIPRLIEGKNIVTNPPDKAELMNTHFSNICNKIKNDTNSSKVKHDTYLKNRSTDLLSLNPTNEIEIEKIINGFRPKKSSGHDGISNHLLKQLVTSLRKTN